MSPDQINAVAAVASAIAAVVSVVVAVSISVRAERFAERESRRADANLAAERLRAAAAEDAQRRLASFDSIAQWRRDLRAWAAEAIDVLSEAIHVRETSPDQCLSCRHRLSALIDRGRYFLPNVRPADHDQHKASAYRGYRHSALDPLVAAYVVLSGVSTGRYGTPQEALSTR